MELQKVKYSIDELTRFKESSSDIKRLKDYKTRNANSATDRANKDAMIAQSHQDDKTKYNEYSRREKVHGTGFFKRRNFRGRNKENQIPQRLETSEKRHRPRVTTPLRPIVAPSDLNYSVSLGPKNKEKMVYKKFTSESAQKAPMFCPLLQGPAPSLGNIYSTPNTPFPSNSVALDARKNANEEFKAEFLHFLPYGVPNRSLKPNKSRRYPLSLEYQHIPSIPLGYPPNPNYPPVMISPHLPYFFYPAEPRYNTWPQGPMIPSGFMIPPGSNFNDARNYPSDIYSPQRSRTVHKNDDIEEEEVDGSNSSDSSSSNTFIIQTS